MRNFATYIDSALTTFLRIGEVCIAVAGICTLLFVQSCSEQLLTTPEPAPTKTLPDISGEDSRIATAWLKMYCDAIEQTPRYTSPTAARTLSYASITLYEALRPGITGRVPLSTIINGFPTVQPTNDEHDWLLVSNAAMGEFFRLFFSDAGTTTRVNAAQLEADMQTDRQRIRRRLQALNSSVDSAREQNILHRSREYGQVLAQAVYKFSRFDGGDAAYTVNFPDSYTPPTGQGQWISLNAAMRTPLLPYWGNNQSLILTANDIARTFATTPPPITYSTDTTSSFYQEASTVYFATSNATFDQQFSVKYWANVPSKSPTHAGHSLLLLTQILTQQGRGIGFVSESYLRLATALNDAYILCWKIKYHYNLLAPQTYLQTQPQRVLNSEFADVRQALAQSPEYIAEQAVVGGLTEHILEHLFGTTRITDRTHLYRFGQREFSSIHQATQEWIYSGLYSGSQYPNSIAQGKAIGTYVGTVATSLRVKK